MMAPRSPACTRALQLGHRALHVVGGQERETDEPYGVGGAELDEPVVVGTTTCFLELDILHLQHAEAGGRVEHVDHRVVVPEIAETRDRIAPAVRADLGRRVGFEDLLHLGGGHPGDT